MDSIYGTCQCGSRLYPVWFTEEETTVVDGRLSYTGRKRRACSHLACSACMKSYCVDDSFDGAWYR